MNRARIAIIGGGLAGLYAANLLEQRGIRDYALLEARERFGGRVLSLPDRWEAGGRFDLGPSWFWPDMQPDLAAVVEALGLTAFRQADAGEMLFERSATAPAQRMKGYPSAPPSWRLQGGMAALTDALRAGLTGGTLLSGQPVTALRRNDTLINVRTAGDDGETVSLQAERVLLAVPPRLAASTVEFQPPLPDDLRVQWQGCATWMAPHAKYVAVFDRPFWRDRHPSGEARSAAGPMVEMHDASSPDGKSALFGFLGLPARARAAMPRRDLLSLCRAQLVRLFGAEAGTPGHEFLTDWAREPYTAVEADQYPDPHHPAAVPAWPEDGPWSDRLVGIASEWSTQFPGYLAGAIDAAERGVRWLDERGFHDE